jgi:hypothetical protein
VPSVFDVVHDNSLTPTGSYPGKRKFDVWSRSYDNGLAGVEGGAPDVTGSVDGHVSPPDPNGQIKIDVNYNAETSGVNTQALTTRFINELAANRYQYSFLHFRDTDDAGHGSGWNTTPGTAYMNAVRDIGGYIGGNTSLPGYLKQIRLRAGQLNVQWKDDHHSDRRSWRRSIEQPELADPEPRCRDGTG